MWLVPGDSGHFLLLASGLASLPGGYCIHGGKRTSVAPYLYLPVTSSSSGKACEQVGGSFDISCHSGESFLTLSQSPRANPHWLAQGHLSTSESAWFM